MRTYQRPFAPPRVFADQAEMGTACFITFGWKLSLSSMGDCSIFEDDPVGYNNTERHEKRGDQVLDSSKTKPDEVVQTPVARLSGRTREPRKKCLCSSRG